MRVINIFTHHTGVVQW